MIKVVKGYPLRLNVGLTNDSAPLNINNGEWTTNVELHYQTKKGPIPFVVTGVPAANTIQIDLTAGQTAQLNHLGTGYVLVIEASNTGALIFLKSELQVSVQDEL